MSNSSKRRQTPAQRAAAQRRTNAARPAPTVLSNEASPIALSTTPPDAPDADDVFDLGVVAREAPGERLRFKVSPGKRVWELHTPEEVDWKENSTLTERATGLEDVRPTLQLLLGGQYEDFLDLDITMGQVSALLEQWREWHGIELPEFRASRR